VKLQRVSKYFGNVALAGWDHAQSKWVEDISRGGLHVYDRFISARSFGQKKRIFIIHKDLAFDYDKYQIVRDPTGTIHVVESVNKDVGGIQVSEEYLDILMLHAAPTAVRVVSFTTTSASSGYRGAKTAVESGPYWCDYERYTVDNENQTGIVMFSGHVFTFPRYVPVSSDNELLVGTTVFDVKEVNAMLLTQEVRAIERGHQ
jgi:hypothetical protein